MSNEQGSVGNKVPIEITHPEWILFRGKVVTELSQKDDGNKGRQKFVVGKGSNPNITSSYVDSQMGMCNSLERSDIIPLINIIWEQSFGIVEGNKKTITERGWYPANRRLLTHWEILATRQTSNTTTQKSDLSSKNCTSIHDDKKNNNLS